jgi:hypothetical protein
MAKKAKDPAEEQARPYGTLAGIRQFLNKFSPPSGSFDPTGAWKQSYTIQHTGGELRVESLITHANGGQQTTATIQCASDALCAPRSWKLESIMRDQAGQEIASTRVVQEATVKDGSIESTLGGRKVNVKTPHPFTSNWSLFAAVQRLDAKQTTPLRFALLEDLDLLKPNQVLAPAGSKTVEVADGKQLALTGFERIGEGILPYRYWLDNQHRLLFVQSGPRAYLYDPEARSHPVPRSKKGKKG